MYNRRQNTKVYVTRVAWLLNLLRFTKKKMTFEETKDFF